MKICVNCKLFNISVTSRRDINFPISELGEATSSGFTYSPSLINEQTLVFLPLFLVCTVTVFCCCLAVPASPWFSRQLNVGSAATGGRH